MFTANPSPDNRMFNRGQVVSLAKEMAGVQVPAMGLVPADKLGPGLVGLTAPDGQFASNGLSPSLRRAFQVKTCGQWARTPAL